MTLLVLIYSGAAAFSGVVATVLWRRKQVAGSRPLTWMMLAVGFWALCDALELRATTVEVKRLISQIQYLGVVSAAPFFFHAACGLSHARLRLTGLIWWAVWAVPVATLAVAWTSQWHEWLWREISISDRALNLAVYRYGWWFWILTAQHYALMLFGTAMLLRASRRVSATFRTPLLLLVLTVMLPWLGNIAYVFKLGPWPGLNWLSLSLMVSGALLAWSATYGGLFDLLPRAREVLAQHIPDGVVVLDRSGRIVFLNPAARELPGIAGSGAYPPETWLAQSAARVEIPVLVGSGIKWLELHKNPIRDRWGEAAGQLMVIRDITARKLAEESAIEWKNRYEAAINASGQILYDWNPVSNKVTYAGDIQRILGYSKDELAGGLSRWTELVHEEDRDRFQTEIDRVLRTPSKFHLTYRVRRKDGIFIHCEDTGHFFLDAHEQVARMVGFVNDVTERTQAEQVNKRLEAQLRQAQKMKAVGTLAGGIAHDFNNILGTIIGNVDLASQDVAADHPVQESLAEIRSASRRARDLVQEILAFSRTNLLQRQPIQLAELVHRAAEAMRGTFPSAIDISVDVESDCPMVVAHPDQVHQALMNLGRNAWQAMGGQGRLEMRLKTLPPGVDPQAAGLALPSGAYVRLSVIDDGKGMDAATTEHIFDPFFTTQAPGEGHGLGLAVVHGIMQNHHGAVSVDSRLGNGTSVHLYFPVIAAEERGTEQSRDGPTAEKESHILYLEDDPALVRLTSRMLERLGYRVSSFTRASEALAALRAAPQEFDLLLTDFQLPGSSGAAVAAEALRLHPNLSVLLASGDVTEEVRSAAEALGTCGVVAKPYSMEAMAETVQRMLSSQRA
ncbi:MAG: histidine kinase N-terminal 7TM domain-containing protein [Acidobacteriota bacterium]